jgi:amino acid adenylation domain-containing protein
MQINALEYLDNTAARCPQRPAFRDAENALTFAEVRESARRVGTALLPLTRKGDPVCVLSVKRVQTVPLFLGALEAGCFYAPVDRDLPAARIRTIVDRIGADVLLTDADSLPFARELGFSGTILSFEDAVCTEVNEAALAARRAAVIDTDPAYVIFTSGSTGVPKGVIGTHRGLVDYVDAICEVARIHEGDVLGNQSPLDYIAGIRDIYLPLKTGARTELTPKKYFSIPTKLFDFLDERGVTAIFWVAPALSLCVQLDAFAHKVPEKLEKIVFTGSALPPAHLRAWQDRLPGRLFINQYGPTEITASCTYYVVPDAWDPDKPLPIGVPFRNTEVLLIDEDGKAAADDDAGEICVRGTGLAPGYYRNPEETARVFTENPLQPLFPEKIYHTGDLGVWGADGLLYFRGRRDGQIKHMGHRVELPEIEQTAQAAEGVAQCACLYDAPKQKIYLFYTGDADGKQISLFLRERLSDFMVPRKYVRVEEFPLLPNGKIDRKALAAHFV